MLVNCLAIGVWESHWIGPTVLKLNRLPRTQECCRAERFLRDNRSPSQFVGGDTQDAAKFVGQINAGEQTMNVTVAPAIDPLNQPDLSNAINRPARPRRPNLAGPPLTLGFQLDPETIARHVAKAQTSIDRSLSGSFESRIEVWVEDQTAILAVRFATRSSRVWLEIMAQLEPGIASVRNELTLRQPPAANR